MKTEFTAEQLADPATAVSAQAIRKCVHCGFCTATCPTYVLLGDERDSPRGRIYLMKEMLEKEQQPTPEVVRHIDRCLSCLACTTTCPSGVDYMHLVDHSRAYIEQHYRRKPSERLMRWMLAKVLPYRARLRLAMNVGRIAAPFARLLPESMTALLDLARRTRAQATSAQDARAVAPKRGRVLLMQGCAESVLNPAIRAATIRMLTRIGYDVVFARDEQCCGALVHHLGREQEGLGFVRRTVDAWSRKIEQASSDGGIDAIIITTSGCGTHVKDYGFLLRNDPAFASRAARIAELAKDVSELIKHEDVRPREDRPKLRVAYQAPCSMQHGQKILAQPVKLLEAAGFEVRTPIEAHLCCGSAGTYNILQPGIAAQLGQRKATNLDSLEPHVVATGNIGCAMHLGAHTKTPIVHTIELLDWATGGEVPRALRTGESRMADRDDDEGGGVETHCSRSGSTIDVRAEPLLRSRLPSG